MGDIFNRFRDPEPDRNAEALTDVKMYICRCQNCYAAVRVEIEHLSSYENGIALCGECDQYGGWTITESLAWRGNAFLREVERFERMFSAWLLTPEGILAQEKARWDL